MGPRDRLNSTNLARTDETVSGTNSAGAVRSHTTEHYLAASSRTPTSRVALVLVILFGLLVPLAAHAASPCGGDTMRACCPSDGV
jgi:hypothetical protein